jgi:CBS domain-containing protein
MRCEEIMTKNPVVLPIEATVLDAARLMAERDVGFIPLLDKSGKAIGTVTDRDIVINCVAKGHDPRTAKLSQYGGNEVVSCMPDEDVSKARKLMEDNQVQRVLVCDRANKPVGVISVHDLVDVNDDAHVGHIMYEVKQPPVH